jgi:hypothetical protein
LTKRIIELSLEHAVPAGRPHSRCARFARGM